MSKEKWGKQDGRKGGEKTEITRTVETESNALSNLLIDIILHLFRSKTSIRIRGKDLQSLVENHS